jgi:NADH:ubiquinone oxidoreductase subunit F (NADH-binding)
VNQPTLETAFPGLLTPRRLSLSEHENRYGPIPWQHYAGSGGRGGLVDAVDAAGLCGRGGAGFPTARKMRAAGERRRPIIVANGCEGEPMSRKDHALLSLAPHLVLDGIMLAAHAVHATEAILCIHQGSTAGNSIIAALAERRGDPVPVRLVDVPPRYVASEESALINFLNTGDARPTVTPPRPTERGVGGRPTLVDNVDTLAQVAVIARVGGETYRRNHTTLITPTGAVRRGGVYEVPAGTRIGEALNRAGGGTRPLQAVLVGGYGGSWLPLPAAASLPLTHEALRKAGASLGVAALFALPADTCGVTETSNILAYLAAESARQCGPCMFGLPAIATDFAELARGRARRGTLERLTRRLGVVGGRGACAHPDGAVRLAASALHVFGADIAAHATGRGCLTAPHRAAS